MINSKRIVVLDTETTGINLTGMPHKNHRIIEIGAIEIIKRRITGKHFHVYLQPNRSIELNAFKIHGIKDDFLLNKPLFKDIAKNFFYFIHNAELVIHNAAFDLGFINQEFKLLKKENFKDINTFCSVTDTLKIARKLFPGKKNTLDALCKRYKINASHRTLHSALIDANLLGKIYLLMTGGQRSIIFSKRINNIKKIDNFKKTHPMKKNNLKILKSTDQEIELHKKYLQYMKNNNICLWN